jgi:hypothetical protein
MEQNMKKQPQLMSCKAACNWLELSLTALREGRYQGTKMKRYYKYRNIYFLEEDVFALKNERDRMKQAHDEAIKGKALYELDLVRKLGEGDKLSIYKKDDRYLVLCYDRWVVADEPSEKSARAYIALQIGKPTPLPILM